MTDIIVAKASAVGTETIPSAIIRIQAEVPDFLSDHAQWDRELCAQFYDSQARMIVDALSSLPAGTLDRVLAQLLARSVSLQRIPWDSTVKK